MKAVILAAGLGTRMGAIGAEVPKCLIEVDGFTILLHTDPRYFFYYGF